jgi:hypothetical protein
MWVVVFPVRIIILWPPCEEKYLEVFQRYKKCSDRVEDKYRN